MKTDRPGIGHNRPPRDKPHIRNGAVYQGFTCGLGAWLFICACADAKGYDRPQTNPVPGVPGFVVERDALSKHEWELLHFRHDWIMALTWFFATSGATTTLPSDFAGSGSTIYCIGAGAAGASSGGGGGGACSYSAGTAYSASQVVNIQVGTGDTWFDTSTTILGKAAVLHTGGLTSTGFGTTKVAGGNGTVSTTGGGGGAGGISAGNNASGSNGGQGDGSVGGAGGAGGNPGGVGSPGTEFQVSPARGAGGGGGGGTVSCIAAGNGGLYGGGGGGVSDCGAGTQGLGAQGLIAGSYTLGSGTPSWGFEPGILSKGSNVKRAGAMLRGDEGIANQFVVQRKAGAEIQAFQPPRRYARAGAIARGDEGIQTAFIRRFDIGFENQPFQPPHRKPERAGAIMQGNVGIDARYVFVQAPFLGWDVQNWQPRKPTPRADLQGHAGIEFPYVFSVTTPVWGWDILLSVSRKINRLLGSGDDGIQNAFIRQFDLGFENQPFQPPHRRFERGGFLVGDTGIQAPFIFTPDFSWAVQTWQPPHPRPERTGGLLVGSPGIDARYVFIQVPFLGWDVQIWQPPHPLPEMGGAIMFGNAGIDLPYVFVPVTFTARLRTLVGTGL